MRKIKIILFIGYCFLVSIYGFAEKYKYATPAAKSPHKIMAEACAPATGKTDLNINNARARINTGGDMWWDLQGNPEYEVPKGSKKTAMFSAALWIAGMDVNGQLKCAAQRYRQVGIDYWTGPLTTDGSASVSAEVCKQYDKHFVVTRSDVEEFKNWYTAGKPEKVNNAVYVVPKSIIDWPGNGDVSLGQSFYLAPYFSFDGSMGSYNPENGDYPFYDFTNSLCKQKTPTYEGNGILVDQILKGDQTIWWVFNDKGNIHTETGGSAIGMEIRAQAFAFTTNDEINNMTFYSYELINRSTFRLTDTYFSQWVDSDIGHAWDDFVGCDVERGLGYTYNGKDVDGTGQPYAYGAHPPAVGVDFFQGPYMDADNCDNPSYNSDSIGGPSFGKNCNIVSLNGQDLRMKYYKDRQDKNKKILSEDIFNVRAEAINGVNFGDGIIDNERFGMRRFVYHNNSTGTQGDPQIAIKYYQLLKGIWGDGTKMLYGGNAHVSSGAYGPACDFMFPGDSDPCNWGTSGMPPQGPKYWTEETANNVPNDRRFMESAGPFTLEPGAVNYITVGVPWARSFSGSPFQSVELLRTVDDKCQRLFDNCFKVLDGPDAPELVIREMDKKFIFYITNSKMSNNYNEGYTEVDPEIITPQTFAKNGVSFDSLYRFEGYQVYQLKDATVSVADLQNPDLARLIFQCDKKNYRKTYNETAKAWEDNYNDPIDKLINNNFDMATGFNMPVVEVIGANNGITHTFIDTLDMFATTDKRLINNKQYYFIAVAYAYNEYMKYSQDPTARVEPTTTVIGIGLEGQKKPYLAGRKAAGGQPITYVVGIPHLNQPEYGGVLSNSAYGKGPQITRIEGQGNGGNVVELTGESIDAILASPASKVQKLTYVKGKGPINVKVIDPLSLVKGNYILKIDSLVSGTTVPEGAFWHLTNTDNGQVYRSDQSINLRKANEQIFLDLGLSISITQVAPPGSNSAQDQNGYLNPSAIDQTFKEIRYADSSQMWLSGVPDINQNSEWNWIRSGTLVDPNDETNNSYDLTGVDKGVALDANQYFEKVISGLWAPYRLCSKYEKGPALNDPIVMGSGIFANKLANLASINLVFTPDKSKWTRACVIETCDDKQLSEANVEKFFLRAGKSVDKEGNQEPSGTGMGWFPGYAINVETGERLNIMFGENSWLVGENGRDMKFNPTSRYITSMGGILWGGMHFVYIFGHNGSGSKNVPAYDSCKFVYNKLKTNVVADRRDIYKDIMWAGIPMAIRGDEANWLSNEVTLRMRVSRPYERFLTRGGDMVEVPQNNNYPMYSFSTADMFTERNVSSVAKNALDIINVVPNPYYSYAAYEASQVDTKIRITNLPEKCTLTIYSINGGIIRQFKIDKSGVSSLKKVGDTDFKTSIDWDLKNHAGIPISSGLYLIHINAPGIGEKLIKWFGTIRPTDVNAF